MGIVYRITQDIIDFVIEQKRNNHKLTCRALVDIVRKQFDTFISKSAINKIIKDAGLSSSVGRKKKKSSESAIPITIPVEPKIRIESFPKPKEELLLTEEGASHKLLEEQLQKLPSLEPVKRSEEIQDEVERKEEREEKEIEEIEEKIEVYIEKIGIEKNKIFDGMGSFLLKAAELELTSEPILSKILGGQVKHKFLKEAEFLGDVLLYLPCFGIKDIKGISDYSNEGLWVLAQQKKTSADLISKYFNQIEKIKNSSLVLHSQSSQLFKEVGFLKVLLEDDTVFYIDPRFQSIWKDSNSPGYFSATHYKTIDYIKTFFLLNSDPIIFLTAAGYHSFSKIMPEFIFACENISDKKIIKIGVFDCENKEIDKFLNFPSGARRFVFGFWPWQKEFDQFSKKINSSTDSCYIEGIHRDIYYDAGESELVQHFVDKKVILRFALLKDSPVSPARMGVLTNIPKEEKSIQEVIKLYLERWPNMEEAYQNLLSKRQRFDAPASKSSFYRQNPSLEGAYVLKDTPANIWDDLSYILNEVNKYAQKHFFPSTYKDVNFSTMNQRFYNLPGYLKKEKNHTLITLLIPKNYEFSKDLSYAIKRFNENDVKDVFHGKISFAISMKALP